jgi:hypothetical protein
MNITVCDKKYYKRYIFNEKHPVSYRKNSRTFQNLFNVK